MLISYISYSVLLAVFADVLFPGPNFILCTTVTVNQGFKKAMRLLMGILLGCFAWCVFLILGFVSLFVKYPFLKDVIKTFGATYLIFLAVVMLKQSMSSALKKEVKKSESIFDKLSKTKLGLGMLGFINCILNPEVGLFYMVMFARVTDVYGISYDILAVYSCLFIAIQFLCFSAFILFFAKMQNEIKKILSVLNIFLSLILLYLSFKIFLSIGYLKSFL